MMKKIYVFADCVSIIVVFLVFMSGINASASPVYPFDIKITQPNGDSISIKQCGDEFFSWKEDNAGNIIVYDENSQSYKYADIINGEIRPGNCEVGTLSKMTEQTISKDSLQPLIESTEMLKHTPFELYVEENTDLFALQNDNILTNQKLLMIMIEFNDVKMVNSVNFWYERMFSDNQDSISVANYYKEVSGGKDVFIPADISMIQDGRTGIASFDIYTDVQYKITKCSNGIVKVFLDIPHPIKTWNNTKDPIVQTYNVVSLAVAAVGQDFNFETETPHVVVNMAGFDNTAYGDGKGQVSAHTGYGLKAPGGTTIGKYAVQGEMYSENIATGIGLICHELGHVVFSLPDMYTDFPASDGLGMYSLMAYGCWGTTEGETFANMPAHLDPWSKIKLGYVVPEVVYSEDKCVNSIDLSNYGKYNVLEIRSNADPNQYFLVENRQLIGYDRGLWYMNRLFYGGCDFNGGIIIYHVDEGITEGNNYNRQHSFIKIEPSTGSSGASSWPMAADTEGNYCFNFETSPSSAFHRIGTRNSCTSSNSKDCHPQDVPSGISLEISSISSSSMNIAVKVDDEFAVGKEEVSFSEAFPDKNFCNAVVELINKKTSSVNSASDIISPVEWIKISTTERLDISKRDISDLTGIEYFTSMNTLDCSGNLLEVLDMSKNPGIELLICSGNNLKELNITGCNNLLYLYCENNQLDELNLANSNNLLWLYCNDNQLNKLDITQNPYLYVIHCYGNYMADIIENSIIGLTKCSPNLGEPGTLRFQYYPQNTFEWIYDNTGNIISISISKQMSCTLIAVLFKDDIPVTTVMREFNEEDNKSISISVPEGYKQNSALKVKAFVWDNILTMEPLSESKTWNIVK